MHNPSSTLRAVSCGFNDYTDMSVVHLAVTTSKIRIHEHGTWSRSAKRTEESSLRQAICMNGSGLKPSAIYFRVERMIYSATFRKTEAPGDIPTTVDSCSGRPGARGVRRHLAGTLIASVLPKCRKSSVQQNFNGHSDGPDPGGNPLNRVSYWSQGRRPCDVAVERWRASSVTYETDASGRFLVRTLDVTFSYRERPQ
jgi:hypothetical protein